MQTEMAGIKAMVMSKAEKHQATWQQYQHHKELAQQQHDQACATAASMLKERMRHMQEAIEQELAALKGDQIMMLTGQQIKQARSITSMPHL